MKAPPARRALAAAAWLLLLAAGETRNGFQELKTPWLNRGTSTPVPRPAHLRGLLPHGEIPLALRVEHAMAALRRHAHAIDKYQFLQHVQDSDETLYQAILLEHTAEVMPIVYTPTVGEACQRWGELHHAGPRGVYVTLDDLGGVRAALENAARDAVDVVVVTDGERILGLGDLGAHGMGIPVGKLALYSCCAGIDPARCLPVALDVGTDNEELRESPSYVGARPRPFEDFGNANAFRLLEEYRSECCCFNDDIQGTAAVVLAGLLSSLRITGGTLADQTFLFFGAGEAGVGIANLVSEAVARETGEALDDARKRVFLVDSQGLVTSARGDLAVHKAPYARDVGGAATLLDAVELAKPTALIGVAAVPGAFNAAVLEAMQRLNDQPVIFALSNPTSKAECTAAECYAAAPRAVFASGSPFDAVTMPDGSVRVPGQGNNAYCFPGIGLGAVLAGATRVTDEDMYAAATALAASVADDRLAQGCVYPPLADIRDVSARVAAAVAANAYDAGTATKLPRPADLVAAARAAMWRPGG
ncbi:malate dehydrogenase [Aureococcus anophagefferens]|nr:malate dehydrogenase [Aureococcus anophagefferens]